MTGGWASPTGNGIVMLEYDDVEQWMMEQLAVPLLNYYNQEIIPVADMNTLIKQAGK